MIQRYGLVWNGMDVRNDKRDDAPYVLYIDHLAAVERRKLLHDAEIVEKEKQIAALRKALERIEAGCSFPEDDVQKAIVKVAREALKGEEVGNEH